MRLKLSFLFLISCFFFTTVFLFHQRSVCPLYPPSDVPEKVERLDNDVLHHPGPGTMVLYINYNIDDHCMVLL